MLFYMPSFIIDYIYILRPEQWLKNLLVLAPPFFAGVLFSSYDMVTTMILAFMAFSLASSTAYVTNDISDIESDKQHPKKKLRPLASGRVSVTQASVLAGAALIVSLILSAFVNKGFLIITVIYLVLSLLYSIYFERIVIVDAFMIAVGFVIRIEAGALASGIEVTSWLLLTTFLLSLLLVFGKRRFELSMANNKGIKFRAVLDHYNEKFLDTALGIFATASLVTYSIYSVSIDSKIFLITIPFAAYGILRYMYLVQTDKSGDPTESLLKDRWLFLCVAIWLLTTSLIIYFQDLSGLIE